MIDNRVYAVLETLAAADLDWLAREIEEGILKGHVFAASPEQLALARELAGRRNQDLGFEAVQRLDVPPDKALTDVEQLDFAAKYIVKRLADVLEWMESSLANLRDLLDTDVRPPRGTAPGPLVLGLNDGEAVAHVSAEELEGAREGLTELVHALADWLEDVRGDGGRS
jgi:hypothetical protein